MAYSLNQVVLIGKVGKDAEVKEIKDGVKVANFSVATSTGGYKKQMAQRFHSRHNGTLYNVGGFSGACKQVYQERSNCFCCR